MKTILVTGGNRGIGLEICRQLDEIGFSVILGSRDFIKGREAASSLGKNVIVQQLDVTNEDSIQNLFGFVKKEFGKLDVLINNAGLGTGFNSNEKKVISVSKKKFRKINPGIRDVIKKGIPLLRKAGMVPDEQTVGNVPFAHVKELMETNLFGAWRMIQVFLPLLQKVRGGRVINISSGMGELGHLKGDHPAYRLSKASLNALTLMFSDAMQDRGVKVNAMCPGWVRTDMGGPGAPKDVAQGADTAIWLTIEDKIPTGKFFRDRQEIEW